MPTERPSNQSEHTELTRDAYDRLAAVWSATTDDGPFNGHLERPAFRALVPRPLSGLRVLDAACGSGAQCEWLVEQGADVVGFDLSPAMVDQSKRRCGERVRLFVGDLADPLDLEPRSYDGVTCSLALHYLEDWRVPLGSFAAALRPGGWAVISSDHPFAPPLPGQDGGYFATELVSDTWNKAHVEVTQHFWRRPLSGIVDAVADAGFAIERIAEPQPSSTALQQFPDELAPTVGVPNVIVYRLRKLTEREAGGSFRRRRTW